jgi:hypothetical protein
MAKLRRLLRRLMAVSAPVALLLETAGYRIRNSICSPRCGRRAQQANQPRPGKG